jgi:hypothetical protein
MKIIRGKDKGKIVEINQWCNNWITSIMGKVYSLTQVQLNPDEIKQILNNQNNGYMFEVYNLLPNGIFKRKKL